MAALLLRYTTGAGLPPSTADHTAFLPDGNPSAKNRGNSYSACACGGATPSHRKTSAISGANRVSSPSAAARSSSFRCRRFFTSARHSRSCISRSSRDAACWFSQSASRKIRSSAVTNSLSAIARASLCFPKSTRRCSLTARTPAEP